MTLDGIAAAKKAAKEFLKRVDDVRETAGDLAKFSNCSLYGTKQTGALRRASMDLTRALADMRRP